MDFEDGYKNGLVSYEEVSNNFEEICSFTKDREDLHNKNKIFDERERVGFLRSKAINSLIHQVTDVFCDNEKDIRETKFDKNLLKNIKAKDIVDKIKEISEEKIYTYKPVIQVEAAGYKVLPGLLETFLNAIKEKKKNGNDKILQLVPDEFKFDYDTNTYNAIMGITMYISGMTDHYAVDTYRNLQGIELPNY